MAQKPNLKCVSTVTAVEVEATAEAKKGNAAQYITLPALYLKVRNRALEDLHNLVGAMFFQVDDVFFEYAQKASNSEDHDACLATMRELRLLRKGLERKLYQHVARLFKELPNPTSELNKPTIKAISSLDELSLVQDDELEETVAIESMISRASDSNLDVLSQLTQRLDALTMNVTVTSATNPLSPKHLCEAFQEASSDLRCDIKYKLIVYKLFERYVLKNFNRIADNSNYQLAKAGVLADLKNTPKKLVKTTTISASKAQANKAQAQAQNAQSTGAQVASAFFEQMQELMASIRGVSSGAAGVSVSNQVIGSVLPSATPIKQDELVNVLSGIQSSQPPTETQSDTDWVSNIAVREMLANFLRERESKKGPEKVEEVDADLINLVSMLFDFILDDKCLPVAIKALIGRLQIPIIKVAMLDHSFFSKSGHPARKLLNELSRAGIGLSGLKMHLAKDPVYRKIRETVQRVLNEFTDNVDLFVTLEKEFSEFINVEVRRSVLIEQRTKAAEEGRAKSDVAKQNTEKALKQCTEGKTIPPSVSKILNDPWSKVLYLTHLKEGGDSRAFQKQVIIAKHLIKSVTPPQNEKEKKYLYDMVPMLIHRLQEGFESISYNPFDANQLMSELEAVQMEVLRGQVPQHVDAAPAESDAVDNLLDAISKDIRQIGQLPKREPEPEVSTSRVVALDTSKKVVAPAPLADLEPLPEDDEDYIAAKAMPVGSWVNIVDTTENGVGNPLRCKLAAYIKSADRMIFVNRNGIKVQEQTCLALAYALKKQTISVIDDALLFDKALENVIGSLRKVRQSAL